MDLTHRDTFAVALCFVALIVGCVLVDLAWSGRRVAYAVAALGVILLAALNVLILVHVEKWASRGTLFVRQRTVGSVPS